MENIWKMLKFNLPPELEGFEEEQEGRIKQALECSNVKYKFINQNWVFLLEDNISDNEINTIKTNLLSMFKSEFCKRVKQISVVEYEENNIYIYKIIFPEKFSTEYLEIKEIEEEFNFIEKKTHEFSFQSLEADIDENVLLFESKVRINSLDTGIINFFETTILESFFSSINFEIEISDKQEIIFSFEVNGSDLTEEEILDFLQSISRVKIINEDSENNIIKEIEYQHGIKNNKILVHDIQKEKILICDYQNCLELGLVFIGYMKNNDKNISITIKSFEYEIIQDLFKEFFIKYNVIPENNLLWLKLMGRKISQEYNESTRNIEDNQHCINFLDTTIKDSFSDYSLYFLQRILKKGYLSEEEYENKPTGCDLAIKDQKVLAKFLQKYIRIEKALMQRSDFNSYWVNSLSNRIYIEKKSKTDPYRIEDRTDSLTVIFAPTEQLIFYIKNFWHQNYVLKIINSIKEDLEKKNDDLQIIDIIPDMQFNLRDKYYKKEKSIDIDILLRLKKKSQNKEYIIAIEAKQKAGELKNSKDELTSKNKIGYEYANIFNGFLMIAYIDNRQEEDKLKINDPEYSEVSFLPAQETMDRIEKKYLLSVEHSFRRLKASVLINIKKICEI